MSEITMGPLYVLYFAEPTETYIVLDLSPRCGIKADRLVTQFDSLTHSLKQGPNDKTLV